MYPISLCLPAQRSSSPTSASSSQTSTVQTLGGRRVSIQNISSPSPAPSAHDAQRLESKAVVASTSIGEDAVLQIFDYLTASEKCAASRTCREYNTVAETSLAETVQKQFEKIGLFERFNGQNFIQGLPKIRYIRAQLGPGSLFGNDLGSIAAQAFTDLRKGKPGAVLLIHNFKVGNHISDQPALMAFVNTHDIRYKTFKNSDQFYHSIYQNKCVILTPNTFSSFSKYGDTKILLSYRLEYEFSHNM